RTTCRGFPAPGCAKPPAPKKGCGIPPATHGHEVRAGGAARDPAGPLVASSSHNRRRRDPAPGPRQDQLAMSVPSPAPRTSASPRAGPAGWRAVAVGAALGAALVWAHRPTLAAVAQRWSEDAQYSHGYVVLVFAAAVLWARRRDFPSGAFRPTAWGLAFLA